MRSSRQDHAHGALRVFTQSAHRTASALSTAVFDDLLAFEMGSMPTRIAERRRAPLRIGSTVRSALIVGNRVDQELETIHGDLSVEPIPGLDS